ncbi:MFS transporter [Actinomadura sp. KC06]|uniref:MFS transporter n=1 Tax=Actinomadura sp. KC06 TaxID=2530369 RepID=UPI0010517A6B|nr:MFS transporter [Actinomadura sp. KC06]TDD39744.1 MFS transporter [Actinomadura sp. KC06]
MSEIKDSARSVPARVSAPVRAALPAARSRAARTAVRGVFFANGAAFASWAARVPDVRDGLGLSAGGLAVALAGLAAGALAGLPLAGVVVARWGSRRTLIGGAVLFFGTLPLIPSAPGLVPLTVAAAMFAVGNSAVDVAMNTQGVLVERACSRPVMGGFHAMFSLGGISGAAVGGLAAAGDVGAGTHFLLTAVVLFSVCCAATIFLLPDAPDTGVAGPAFAFPPRGLWAPALIALSALMGEGLMNDWGAVYLRDVAGSSAGAAATGFAVFSAGMVAGRLAADRMRSRAATDRFVQCCSLLAGAGAVLALVAPSPGTGLVAYALIGLGLAPVVPVAFSHAASHTPRGPGPSIAAVSTVGYVGFLAGPPIVGGVAEAAGLRVTMVVLLILTCALSVLAPRLGRA